ncbi:DUF6318 family protein [Mumia sp. ZJ430]|uniref:DUF6318 family protein n=1 Tax=Mumia sp. ZJ430 TaxID=2708083 RepID=UPI0014200C81|nr:DUF6318 family protein [Mumia sp. ZJ430]
MPLRLRSSFTLVLAVLVVSLYAAGCGPQERPASAQTPTPTTTVARASTELAEPAVLVPTLSRAADEFTAAAAQVFFEHYYRLINHAARTGDTRPLRQASAAECRGCDNVADQIDRAYKTDGGITGFWWDPYYTHAMDEQDYKVAAADIEADAYTYRRSADAKPNRVRKTEHHHLLRARRYDGRWRMIFLSDQAALMPDGYDTDFPMKAPHRPRFSPLLS